MLECPVARGGGLRFKRRGVKKGHQEFYWVAAPSNKERFSSLALSCYSAAALKAQHHGYNLPVIAIFAHITHCHRMPLTSLNVSVYTGGDLLRSVPHIKNGVKIN